MVTLLHARVLGIQLTVATVIANRHAPAAAPAQHQALQQRGPLARWPTVPIGADRLRALVKAALVALVLVPRNVARVCVGDQCEPLFAGHALQVNEAVYVALPVVATVDEGAGISWVVQHAQDLTVIELTPEQFSSACPLGTASREHQVFEPRSLDRGAGRTCARERREQPP